METALGIVAVACFGHGSSSLHAGRHSASPVFCENRKMTNSAGFTGATPTRQMSRPASMSAWVVVSRSHLTKNASSWVRPASAPERQTPSRRSEEHTSELQSLMRISYAVFCLKKKKKTKNNRNNKQVLRQNN